MSKVIRVFFRKYKTGCISVKSKDSCAARLANSLAKLGFTKTQQERNFEAGKPFCMLVPAMNIVVTLTLGVLCKGNYFSC